MQALGSAAPAVQAGTAVCLDDDPLVATVFLAACRKAGVQGRFASDLGEFQRIIGAGCPAVVLLDQVMPDSTGAEVILWLRGTGCRPKVIAIGGDSLYVESAAVLVRGGGLDLAGAMRKPLRLEALAEAIREAAVPGN